MNTEFVETLNEYGCHHYTKTDENSFEFNLYSKGRLPGPMKFEIKHLEYGGLFCLSKYAPGLIQLGDINLRKENQKELSYCVAHDDNHFNYHGIKYALCGGKKYKYGDDNIIPERILVIQMK